MDKVSDEKYYDGHEFVTGDEAMGALGNIIVGLFTLLVIVPFKLAFWVGSKLFSKPQRKHRA